MAEIIRMPKMSDTMEEGVIASWLKKVGDEIKTVGEFKVVLNLHSEIESSIKIKVVPEELVK